MGKDIKAIIEYKDEFGDWEKYSTLYLPRHVDFFEASCDYRSPKVLFEQKGLPEDCSDPTYFKKCRGCSWLSLDEVCQVLSAIKTNKVGAYYAICTCMAGFQEECRLVFGFED
jgi:hypothetical protein